MKQFGSFKPAKVLIAALFLAVFAWSVFSFPPKNEFIGYRHQGVTYGETLPNGAKDLGGGLLSDENYGVTRFSRGETFMLWFEKIVERNSKGVPHWEVKDFLNFKNLPKNQEFLFSYSSTCTQNNRKSLDLIVMAELNPQAKKYKVLKAWQANIKREKFEEISTKGISCGYKPV